MSNQIFPALPGFDIAVKRTPLFSTQIQAAPSGKELRASWWSFPRWQYDLTLNFVRQAGFSAQTLYDEAATLVSFHAQHRGSWDSFLFSDPYDSSDTAMGFGVGDGTTTVYQLQRREPGVYSNALGTFSVPTTPRTNLCLQSQNLSASWSAFNAFLASGAGLAPDGTATAGSITDNTTSGQHNAQIGISGLVIGQTYTASIFLKAGTLNFAYIQFYGVGPYVMVNLTTGAVDISSGSYQVTALPNGWYRLSVQRVAAATTETLFVGAYAAAGISSYVGSGNGNVYAWGAQVEAGSVPTDYIPTTTATVTVKPAYYPGTDGFEPITEPAPGLKLYSLGWQGNQLLYPTPRTNCAANSAQMQFNTPTNSVLTGNAIAAPDGNTTGCKLTDTATTAQHRIDTSVTGLVVGRAYLAQAYFKPGTLGFGFMQMGSDWIMVNLATAAVDLQNSTYTITALPNGWVKLTIQHVAASTSETLICGCYAVAGSSTYSGASGYGYLWGAQVELGTTPTGFITTNGSPVTVTDYTLTTGGVVTFAVAPALGAVLTWTGGYYRRVRFDQDDLPFERIVNLAWKGGASIKLLGVR